MLLTCLRKWEISTGARSPHHSKLLKRLRLRFTTTTSLLSPPSHHLISNLPPSTGTPIRNISRTQSTMADKQEVVGEASTSTPTHHSQRRCMYHITHVNIAPSPSLPLPPRCFSRNVLLPGRPSSAAQRMGIVLEIVSTSRLLARSPR